MFRCCCIVVLAIVGNGIMDRLQKTIAGGAVGFVLHIPVGNSEQPGFIIPESQLVVEAGIKAVIIESGIACQDKLLQYCFALIQYGTAVAVISSVEPV